MLFAKKNQRNKIKLKFFESNRVKLCQIALHRHRGESYHIAWVLTSYVSLMYWIVSNALRWALHRPQWWRCTPYCELITCSKLCTFRKMLTDFLINFLCLLSLDRHSTVMICIPAICILNKHYRDFKNLSVFHKHFQEVTSELHKLSVWSAKRFLLCVWVGTDGLVCNGNAFPRQHSAVC